MGNTCDGVKPEEKMMKGFRNMEDKSERIGFKGNLFESQSNHDHF